MPLDDEDSLVAPPSANRDAPPPEDEEDSEIIDWKSISSSRKRVSSKNIRKGGKDFESHGTRAQDGALEASRGAMEEALGMTRTHRRDEWCRGWLFSPEEEAVRGTQRTEGERCVVVEHQRATWAKDMGRTLGKAESRDGVPRLWLLPEEALFLVERGSIDLWWPERSLQELIPTESPSKNSPSKTDDYDIGIPLSLEAAYSFLIGEEGERGKISLAKYQVFSHLKRSGIHVLRAPETAPPPEPKNVYTPEATLWQWLTGLVPEKRHDPQPWGPLVQPGLYRSYRPIFNQLSIMPRHKPTPEISPETPAPEDPWKVFYHIWRSTGAPFSKRNPPPPDFLIAVTDTVSDGIPTLEQIDALLKASSRFDAPECNPSWQGPGRMYQRLKHGHRSVLVAVVDGGLVNFMRMGEGAFGQEDVVGRFDRPRGGGKRGGRGGGRGGRGGRGRGRR